jgi:hypothetical protein
MYQQNTSFTEETIRNSIATAINCTVEKLPHYLRESQVAFILGLNPTTLRVWRSQKRYDLPYLKSGRLIRYMTDDVVAFMTARHSSVMREAS